MGYWYDKNTAEEMLSKLGTDPNIIFFTRKEMDRIIIKKGSTTLGEGGFGSVCKGKLNGRPVAVKEYKINKTQKNKFTEELIIHSQFIHKNIVRLLGCCVEADSPKLVIEFVPNGNLSDLLHNNSLHLPVSLKTRLQIALGVAEALAFMHWSQYHPILHLDIKSSNILLGDKHVAKLCDFGLSRILCMDKHDEFTEHIKGTIGYLDPYSNGRLSLESDVYSFGVVLLELITRRKAIINEDSLAALFVTSYSSDKRHELFDNEIVTNDNVEFIEKIADLAVDCLKNPTTIEDRPQMGQVFENNAESIEKIADLAVDCLKNPTTKEDRPQMGQVFEKLRNIERGLEMKFEELRKTRIKTMGEIENTLRGTHVGKSVPRASIDAILRDLNKVSTSEALTGETSARVQCAAVHGKVVFLDNGDGSLLLKPSPSPQLGKINEEELEKTKSVLLIKMPEKMDEDWKQKFVDEMKLQSTIDHWNISRLVGWCLDDVDAPVLVYEHGVMRLHDALFGDRSQRSEYSFSWKARIAVAAAVGLARLHQLGVVHGDVSTDNILLDDHCFQHSVEARDRTHKFPAKIAGAYGRLLSVVHYKDPRFKTANMAHHKYDDVYHFGVLLMELFTEKKIQMLDDDLLSNFPSGCAHLVKIKELASHCLAPKEINRPDMARVEQRLRNVLEGLQNDHNKQNDHNNKSIYRMDPRLYHMNSCRCLSLYYCNYV